MLGFDLSFQGKPCIRLESALSCRDGPIPGGFPYGTMLIAFWHTAESVVGSAAPDRVIPVPLSETG